MRFFSIRPPSYNGLLKMGMEILESSNAEVRIESEFLRPYCIVFLDQLLLNATNTLSLQSSSAAVNQYLAQMNFPHLDGAARMSGYFPQDHIISLKRFSGDLNQLAEAVPQWLQQEVFSKSFAPRFGPAFRRQIVKNLWEIVCNTIHHSESPHGISCCGQFYPECGYFEIAFYDYGVGIPGRIRQQIRGADKYSDYQCLRWALQKGTTTQPLQETRGLGLYYLRNFLTLNGGWLQAISHRGMLQLKGAADLPPVTLRRSFPGTMINLRIIYDEAVYQLKGEND